MYFFLGNSGGVLSLTKMGWASFWAIFSQAHLVSLSQAKFSLLKFMMKLIQTFEHM
jgi:hypothetical protein